VGTEKCLAVSVMRIKYFFIGINIFTKRDTFNELNKATELNPRINHRSVYSAPCEEKIVEEKKRKILMFFWFQIGLRVKMFKCIKFYA